MCGVVCFFGQNEGIIHVLEALHLLEYRAPDSAGIATLTGPAGQLAVRRNVGATKKLVEALTVHPLYNLQPPPEKAVTRLLQKQALDLTVEKLRDCSPAAGYTLHHLYFANGLHLGLGDRGGWKTEIPENRPLHLSTSTRQILENTGGLSSPDFDQDPMRHAFRLLSAQVAGRAACDPAWRATLDEAFLARVPAGAYSGWQEAWGEEMVANTPGQAFAVAVRRFQETFPGLAEHLAEEEWERVGGLTAQAMAHIILGHGRWAMVGAVTAANAHPLLDRSQTRAVCENGSHNAPLTLKMRAEQEAWWQARGVSANEPVHRSENTTEVIAYEWERAYHQLFDNELAGDDLTFHSGLKEWDIDDPEEQALRLALWRLRTGNTHACAFYSCRQPGNLYVSSHRKPIAIAIRIIEAEETGPSRYELMVASDVNAALMLWPGDQVDAAATRIEALQKEIETDPNNDRVRQELEALLRQFTVEVVFLDDSLFQGQQLLTRLQNRIEEGEVVPDIQVSRYDGTPITVNPRPIRLNPAMIGRRGYATYTESHIAEIPDVLAELVRSYVRQGKVRLNSMWQAGELIWPGLNVNRLRQHFGSALENMSRLLLIGEGSSWRDAQAAAPLFRSLLPNVMVITYRPVELLNVGPSIDPIGDLAIEISWSGTTDSVLKVDNLLVEMGVMRLGITGRPQSDLGRRTAYSAGTIDVRSGVEVSVATVKGFEAILACLDLLAIQLAELSDSGVPPETLAQLVDELTLIIPKHVGNVINDEKRRERLRQVAAGCRRFNKVAVVGNSPVDIEGELKIEELAQIVACPFDFHDASLRSLIEQSAIAPEDQQRILFIINATGPEQQREAQPILNYLHELGVFCLIHSTPHPELESWQIRPNTELFISPHVSDLLQPLIDAPFFFDLAVAMAYGRGLSPEEIDRPRNLAKSVTTTAAEPRAEIEARQEFHNITLSEFGAAEAVQTAWDTVRGQPSRAALRATAALRSALAVLNESLPEQLALEYGQHLVVVTDTEATENASWMAAVAWQRLLGMDLTVYRRFISDFPEVSAGTVRLRFIRAGAILSVRDSSTIALPTDMTPLQLELLGAVYLIGLAVRLARQRGSDTTLWEAGLSRLPLVLNDMLSDSALRGEIRSVLSPLVAAGYDKVQVIGGGQDQAAAQSMARSLRRCGFLAEPLYTDSAWHGPLATVGGPDSEHDTLIIILATDPLFQSAALVDTQVYRTRHAPVLLVVPTGNENAPAVRGVEPTGVLAVPGVPHPFTPIPNVILGDLLATTMARLWEQPDTTDL